MGPGQIPGAGDNMMSNYGEWKENFRLSQPTSRLTLVAFCFSLSRQQTTSLRSKRFRRVWEQIFGILPARKMGREPKKERWG